MPAKRKSEPAEAEHYTPDLRFEQEARAAGYATVCGIDEAGRGPLAGPVVAAAVVLPPDFELAGLTDSKQLTAKKRDKLFEALMQDERVQKSIAFATAAEIDEHNILRATHIAMARAAQGLPHAADAALIDGLPVPNFPLPSKSIVKGDSRSLSIAAASILAKVTRDRYMQELDAAYPAYGFAKHAGYGTAAHLAALREHGPCAEHRRSFAPVAQLLAQPELPLLF